ncbi:MAG: hypothetical protein IT440_02185 [Phycisphaeraceae bacterium]|nr:hypothetical protein [Phycisphaeraceae bacterium]
MDQSYSVINGKTWQRLLRENTFDYQPPLTVHLPIQPIHCPDWIHVDPGLTVCRRRVYPNMSSNDVESCNNVRKKDTLLVQFALDDPPFVPDFHFGKVSLEDGYNPVATVEYFAWDIRYRFRYYCVPVGKSRQCILWIHGMVANESDKKEDAVIRAKVNIQPEAAVYDYHYVPFYWDAGKWRPCDRIGFDKNIFTYNDRPLGKLDRGPFTCEWEIQHDSHSDDYNKKSGCGEPYFVTPHLRLTHVDHVVRLHKELTPGESASFCMALLTDIEDICEEDLASLAASAADDDLHKAMVHFQSALANGQTELVCPAGKWDLIFRHLQLSTMQMLVRFDQADDLMPCQGGTSDRYFVWIWEAAVMLIPMIWLGHHQAVRQVIDYIFKLQNGGFPPEGEFVSLDGAVGTTGPKWANSTGSALALAAEYALYVRDESFLRTYLPKLLQAGDWILREIRATRKLQSNGARPLYYGLMPLACATDGDTGYSVAFTDCFTYWGLRKLGKTLEAVGHPRAAEFASEIRQYHQDINTALQGMARPDGHIDRMIKTGRAGEVIYRKFDHLCGGPLTLAYAGIMDVREEVYRRFVACNEKIHADGCFLGPMDRDVMYMGTGEWIYQDVYLRLGEWKKAFVAMQTNLKYGMTQDAFQVQERFSKSNPAFTPWQPNGSGNGRILEMMIKSFLFDDDESIVLLGGIPFAWLTDNGLTALRNLAVPGGTISIEIVSRSAKSCELTLSTSTPGLLSKPFRFPDHFLVQPLADSTVRKDHGLFACKAGIACHRFLLSDNDLQ